MCQPLATSPTFCPPKRPHKEAAGLEEGRKPCPTWGLNPIRISESPRPTHRLIFRFFLIQLHLWCRAQLPTFSKMSFQSCLAGCKCCSGELLPEHLPTPEVPSISHHSIPTSLTKGQWPMRLSPNSLLYINHLTLFILAGNKKMGEGWASRTRKGALTAS